MAKYTELFFEYLEGGGELPTAVVTSKRNKAVKRTHEKLK